ncbi:MAG: S8 family serine peptidase, partial [Prevotellaceae bacterium]|nr:S8 family serine peptidase [Prevotellaceae bacterium]
MKRLALFFTFLCSILNINCFSQASKVENEPVFSDGKYQVQSDRVFFEVDTTVFTVKLINPENKLDYQKYKILRTNELGFTDIAKPDEVSLMEFARFLSDDEKVEKVIYNSIGSYDMTPNDSLLGNQWHLSVIRAFDAWDYTTGSPNIVIGVLDSGSDWMHPDLGIGNDSFQNIFLNSGEDVWTNPDDPTTGNGIDDDNNGYIDDWKGWNFADNNNNSRGIYFHGTFVAGIVSAKTNNITGIAGIAGGNHNIGSRILPYCVGNSAPLSAVIDDAILAAVNEGARVIQFSLQVGQTSAIDAALSYAASRGVIIICASGNGGYPYVYYPASDSNVIAVGAINQSNQRVSSSNYGHKLALVAPGVDIYSTTLNSTYTTSSGTSFAAPQVSAVVALMLSRNPTLSRSDVETILYQTAQKVGGYNYQSGYPYGTWNNEMGYGLVDAYAAIQLACTY